MGFGRIMQQMWAGQFYDYDKPRTFLTSAGLGAMGYGREANDSSFHSASLSAQFGNFQSQYWRGVFGTSHRHGLPLSRQLTKAFSPKGLHYRRFLKPNYLFRLRVGRKD